MDPFPVPNLEGSEASGFGIGNSFGKILSLKLFSIQACVALNYEWPVTAFPLHGHWTVFLGLGTGLVVSLVVS